MDEISTIGMDTAKSVFQLHGIDAMGDCKLLRRLKRREVLAFFAKQPACVVALEACGASHYWGREIEALGHTVKLVPPPFAKRFAEGRVPRPTRAMPRPWPSPGAAPICAPFR